MGKAIVARPVNGITLNGNLEFLLDDAGEVKVFNSPEEAKSFLLASGVDSEERRHMTIMESCGTCCRCGSPLFKSLLPGYDYQILQKAPGVHPRQPKDHVRSVSGGYGYSHDRSYRKQDAG